MSKVQRRSMIVAAGMTAALMALAGCAGQPVTLAKDGVAKAPILAGSVQPPVEELGKYLRRITGAEFQIQPAAPGAEGILVGLAEDFPWLKLDKAAVDALGEEGFILRSQGGSLLVVAKGPLGVRHGVVTLLQKLGCRWFFPGDHWEVVPSSKTLTLAVDETQKPTFNVQRTIWYGFGSYQKAGEELDAWKRHNRMGGPMPISIGHTGYGIDNSPQALQEHPEWFAMVGGARKTSKPCYSNPEVIRMATEYALAAAGKGGGKGMVSMSPPDLLGFCECPKCMAVLQGGAKDEELTKKHGTCFGTRPDGTLVNVASETLFSMINQVADAVAKEYPDYMLGCYSYSGYSHPASFKLRPNVYVQTTNGFRRTPLSLDDQLEQWGTRARKVDIREYWSVYQWDADGPDPGKMAPRKMQPLLKQFLRHGVAGVNPEASDNWGPRGLGYYAAAQMEWDINTDLQALEDDFYQKAFGPAATPMRRYYERWYNRPEVPKGQPKPDLAADLKAAYQDLDEAVALAKDSPPCLARVNDLRMYAHYLFLRTRVAEAMKSKDKDAIAEAVKADTVFGGRLADTHMIHARPLLGKEFARHFAAPLAVLGFKDRASGDTYGKDFRKTGTPPTAEELQKLWEADKAEMAK